MSTNIDVRDLVVDFRNHRAVDRLSLEFDTGVNGLLGPNGAGKTTLIRVLATVAQPDKGEVRMCAQPVPRRDAELRQLRRTIGYLPQEFGCYPRFTAREFVEYFAWLKEVPAARIPVAVDSALERVDLTAHADTKIKRLSGGMRRRVGIAQAIVNEPSILLLDEPTAGLDPEQRVLFRDVLRRLGQDSCVVVSTHLIEDVANACQRVSIMDTGRHVFTGTPDQLVALGNEDAAGDTELERGYTTVLRRERAAV